MNETQRFLRYVTPGLVFLAETILLLLILLPDWTVARLQDLKDDEDFGVVFATLLVSGGVGFIFSILHHLVHWTNWKLGAPAIDHSALVDRLRQTEVVELLDASTGAPIADEATVNRADAWVIATSLWHERRTTSEQIKAADPRAELLTGMVHSTGTTCVASVFAWIAALVIAAHVAQFAWEWGPVMRFFVASGVGLLLVLMHRASCFRIVYLAQRLVEEVLHDALRAENERPIKTAVVLAGQGPRSGGPSASERPSVAPGRSDHGADDGHTSLDGARPCRDRLCEQPREEGRHTGE